MPGAKKLREEHLFPLEKLFFLPTVEKSSPQSFSVPGIMFPARRNIYFSNLLLLMYVWLDKIGSKVKFRHI